MKLKLNAVLVLNGIFAVTFYIYGTLSCISKGINIMSNIVSARGKGE